MKKIYLIAITLLLLFALNGCKSGKKAYEQGNYYQSVIQSVEKLRNQPKNKKAKAVLRQAYPLAVQTLELNSQNLLVSNADDKWKNVLINYNRINHMYEEILRSPEALKIIPEPINYYSQLAEVKKNAAEETYAKGLLYLNRGTRDDAKLAYSYFKEVQLYVTDFKDVNAKMEEARIMATLFIMVVQDPVPANFSVSGNYFRNKIDEYLHASEAQYDFIEFYNPEEMVKLGIHPDHRVELRYQDFSIGNVYLKESKEELSKDSIVVATIKVAGEEAEYKKDQKGEGEDDVEDKDEDHSGKVAVCHKSGNGEKSKTLYISPSALQAHLDHGDVIGTCEGDISIDDHGNDDTPVNAEREENVYGTVKATLTTYEKTITSTAMLSMTITEELSGKVLKESLFPVDDIWSSKWGSFNGDERALSAEELSLCDLKEQPAPSRDAIFNLLSEKFYTEVTRNFREFYQNY